VQCFIYKIWKHSKGPRCQNLKYLHNHNLYLRRTKTSNWALGQPPFFSPRLTFNMRKCLQHWVPYFEILCALHFFSVQRENLSHLHFFSREQNPKPLKCKRARNDNSSIAYCCSFPVNKVVHEPHKICSLMDYLVWHGRPGFDSRQMQNIVLYSTASRPPLRPTQSPIRWVPGALIKWSGSEADHSLPSSAKVKNVRSRPILPVPHTSSWHSSPWSAAYEKFRPQEWTRG
jgi:hypothetical protein